jgi:hypothetical protein
MTGIAGQNSEKSDLYGSYIISIRGQQLFRISADDGDLAHPELLVYEAEHVGYVCVCVVCVCVYVSYTYVIHMLYIHTHIHTPINYTFIHIYI